VRIFLLKRKIFTVNTLLRKRNSLWLGDFLRLVSISGNSRLLSTCAGKTCMFKQKNNTGRTAKKAGFFTPPVGLIFTL
jgi:hypothetical protein